MTPDSVRPIAAHRRQRILDLAREHGVVSVRELCDALGVSDMTIRRDFGELERRGALRRTHGGAVALTRPTFNYTYAERADLRQDAKDAIGAAAARLVEDGDTLFLGSSTTVLALARHLRGRERLTIVTDSIPIVQEVWGLPACTVICAGGVASLASGSMVGPIAEATIRDLRVRRAFIGATGVSPEGFSSSSLEEASVHRLMLANAGETYVLADHTKFGKLSLVMLASLDRVAGVVTNEGTALEARSWLRDAGRRLIVAPARGS
jgi:DeoR/GlpR family transcriptional regulator of sugar metabolism